MRSSNRAMAEWVRSFHHSGQRPAAPDAETRETNIPERGVAVIAVQLVEVGLCQHTSGDETFFEKLVRHLDEPCVGIASAPDRGHAIVSQFLNADPFDKRGEAAPEYWVHRAGSLHGGPQGPFAAVEFRRARVVGVGRP